MGSRPMKYDEKRSGRTVFKKFADINDLFISTYHVGPYGGCEFGCAYCDAWSHGELPLNKNICAYSDFLEKFSAELPNTNPDEAIGFTLADPYQPVEKVYRLSRQALKILGSHQRSVVILTKSPLVLDDIDLLKQMNTHAFAIVATTLVTFDQNLLPHLEAHAPLPEDRMAMMATLKDSGVPCGFALNPILPFLTDNKQKILNLLKTLSKVRPDFIVWDYLWIPNPCHKNRIKKILDDIDDRLVPKYNTLYNGNPQPDREYRRSTDRFLIKACRRMSLEPRIPPRLYQDHLAPASVAELKERRNAFLSF